MLKGLGGLMVPAYSPERFLNEAPMCTLTQVLYLWFYDRLNFL